MSTNDILRTNVQSSTQGLANMKRNNSHRPAIGVAVWLLATSLAFGAAGCFDQLGRVNRVQTNLIDKSVFEGEWWFMRTVIEMDDDAAYAVQATGTFSPWVGAMADYDLVANSGVVGRIRWVIDERFIYAYRSTEAIVGSNPDAGSAGFRGSPLAVYRILDHVDVRQEFNPGTGEPTNVISESRDRRWYDRQFVRVDWSTNLVTFGLLGASLEIDQLFGAWRREPVPLNVSDEGNTDLPADWRPQFVRIGEDDTYRFRAEWPTGTEDTIHYMSFVTRDMWTPISCFGGTCGTSIVITMRDAFLRIPPEHEYAAETLANSEYDRFGILRTEARTYVRGGLERDTLGQFCDAPSDCLTGACNMATHRCTGGLTDELGETDFLTFYRLRHNFYADSLTERACTADWECSERGLLDTDGDGIGDTSFDADGDGVRDGGSVCDPAARRCTIPLRDRPVRRVAYYTNPGHPDYLLRPAFQLFAQWNESFMAGNRGVHGDALPTGPRVECQDVDPTNYCYCGATISAAEVAADGTCAFRYDFSRSPAENRALGVTDPYECYIAGAGDASLASFDIAHPTSFGDYGDYTQLHFVGDECMLVLNVNSCDARPGAACEQLGDIRYNMFNYIDAPADFCGVMQPVQDPTNGEAIVSPVNMAGRCIDTNFTAPLYTWPILRGDDPDARIETYISGEELRNYMEARERVHPPEVFAPGGDPGRPEAAGARPTLPVDLHGVFTEGLMAAMERGVERLHGEEGRRLIMSDRIHNGMGTALEERLAGVMAHEGYVSDHPEEAIAAAFLDSPRARPVDIDVDDPETLDRLSPFRDAYVGEMTLEARRDQALMERGICVIRERAALSFSSQFGRYWAEAFRGVPLAEAHLRWNQAWFRAVMQHELGHGLGMEHNFGGTLDRDNYQTEWFNIEFDAADGGRDGLALPRPISFDMNGDGELTTTEWEAYRRDLERVRAARNLAGAGNYMTSSTMDYPGDLSDQMGIAPYDRAAMYYNYFGLVEGLANSRAEPAVHVEPGSSRDRILRTDTHAHSLMTFYRGGEACQVDAECPYSEASGALRSGQPIFQRCVTNPRFSSIPQPCTDVATGLPRAHCICSSFDSDFDDFVAGSPGTGYVSDADSDGAADLLPIRYLFGSNPRVNDISWCTWFDAGESFVETINFYREQFLDQYLLSYFRRYRRGFGANNMSYRYVLNASKVYQHLLFRAIYEPGYFTDPSPVGFDDQYQASIAAMNWLAELATMPDVGSYELNPFTNTYERMGEAIGMAGADAVLEPGIGFHHWSRFQDGNVGFFRLERSGVMWDKLRALQALTIRDWGLSFTIDERYYINFYDFFPGEMTELFGGFILDEASWYAPRVVTAGATPEIEYPNWYVANGLLGPQCTEPGTGEDRPCRGTVRSEYTDPAIDGTSNDVLRTYAAVFALAEFPVFYDTSWERRLAIFTLENGDGFAIPDFQPDGSRTCYVGPERTDPDHIPCASPADADYITYTSDRVHTTYVAVRVRTSINAPLLEEEQLGFEFLSNLQAVSDRIGELTDGNPVNGEGGPELDQLRRRRVHDESFLVTLIELQRIFGITSWL